MDDKINQKIVMDEELVQNDVMDEELVQNGVMDGNFVKNFVMDAKMDPKVVMHLSTFTIGGFFVIQCLERHSVSSDQHMKKLMSPRESLHVMMQCYMRQHFVDCYWLHEHPGGHAPWREPTMIKFTKGSTTYFVKGPVCRWNVLKM